MAARAAIHDKGNAPANERHPVETVIYQSFHAHVYYDPDSPPSREHATRLREGLAAHFPVQLGRWHDVPVGPHPRAMYQVAFAHDAFAGITQYLMAHHGPLPVLIHPNGPDPVADHLEHALWLGERLPLDGDFLRQFVQQGKMGPAA